MGFPGFRVGIIYSYNDAVVNCARKMSSFGLVSTQTQYLLASMLSDDEFVERFLEESAKRLAKRYGVFCRGLAQVGIKCLASNAGLFLWMDLRRLLKKPTFEAEMELWKVIIEQVKINISPGSSFHCSEPGWFRVCYANMDDRTVEVSLARMRTFVNQNTEAKKSCSQRNLRLSFSFRKMDEYLVSPHSPFPQSPLVKASTWWFKGFLPLLSPLTHTAWWIYPHGPWSWGFFFLFSLASKWIGGETSLIKFVDFYFIFS